MKFACQQSCGGKCCTMGWDGENSSFIFLTESDLQEIEKFTGLDRQTFAQESHFSFTRFLAGRTKQWHLKTGELACRFLRGGKCSIYEARPTQCRTYPFWPENTEDPIRMKGLGEFCPGLEVADEDDSIEIDQSLLEEQIAADKELCARSLK